MMEGWSETTIGDVLEINPKVKISKDVQLPFIDMQSIDVGYRNVYPFQYRNFSGGSRFEDGDTLMARITPCLENGKIARFKAFQEDMPAHGSTEFIVLRNKKGVTHNRFVYYLVISDLLKKKAIAQMTGSSGRQRVPTDSFKRIVLNIPSIKEQEAISDILEILDDKIELNRKMNEALKAIVLALFKSWFVDFDPVRAKMEGRKFSDLSSDIAALFPDKLVNSSLGEIPEGWEIKEIAELVDATGGGTPSTKETSYWDGGTIYWATPKDLSNISSHALLNTERKITEKGVKRISSGILPAGTVLLSSRAPIGYLVVSEIPVAINQGFIAMKPKGSVGTQYVLQWTLENMEIIKSRANGSTFQEISKKSFRSIPAIMPRKEILAEFERIAGALHARVVENLRQNMSLSSIRDALLPKLISGELRVDKAVSQIEDAI